MRNELEKRLANAAKIVDLSDLESTVSLLEALAKQRLSERPPLRLVVGGSTPRTGGLLRSAG